MKGRISDDRFAMTSRTCEDEQAHLKSEAEALQREIEQQAQNEVDLESVISR